MTDRPGTGDTLRLPNSMRSIPPPNLTALKPAQDKARRPSGETPARRVELSSQTHVEFCFSRCRFSVARSFSDVTRLPLICWSTLEPRALLPAQEFHLAISITRPAFSPNPSSLSPPTDPPTSPRTQTAGISIQPISRTPAATLTKSIQRAAR